MRITSSDLRDLKILKNYRLIRKWICKFNDISEPDLELLIYLDSLETFTKKNYKEGVYYYSWDNRRWNRLLKNDWIKVWRFRNRTTQKYNIYKVSFKGKQLINRIYKIMLKEEELPTSIRRNKIMKGNSYMDKVMITSIKNVNKDI